MRCPACGHNGTKKIGNTAYQVETIWRRRFCRECGIWFETEEIQLYTMSGNKQECMHEHTTVVATEQCENTIQRVRRCDDCGMYFLTEEKPFHIRTKNDLMRQRWLERREAKKWRQLSLFDEAVQ